MVEDEVIKFDPDASAQLLKAEGYLDTFGKVATYLTPTVLADLLALAPPSLASELPPDLVAEVEAKLAALPADIVAAKADIEKLRTALAAK